MVYNNYRMETIIEMDYDWGYPHFRKPPYVLPTMAIPDDFLLSSMFLLRPMAFPMEFPSGPRVGPHD